MTQGLVEQLFSAHAFDPMLLDVDMREYHVPFDELTGTKSVESHLRTAVSKYERVALTGYPGSGKTSVARFSLDPPPDQIAPIWVPVAYKSDGVTREPMLFAQYLVEVILDTADAVQRMPSKQRDALLAGATSDIRLPTEARRLGLGAAIRPWIFQGNIALDITRTAGGGSLPRSEESVLNLANDIIGAIKAYGLAPILVMDDTDRLIGRDKADEVIPAFFGNVLRAVVEHLHAGIVVAAHPFYLDRPDYRRHTTGLIERHIQIPQLETAAALAAIFKPRIAFVSKEHDASDVFDPDALDGLFAAYASQAERSIRSALAVAHAALGRAETAGANTITREHVEAGADDAMIS